ncbi:hypothetical protein EON63_18580 [archaeon]|nr:MAG: hypothetical protein EON63_18580 [archaeon]
MCLDHELWWLTGVFYEKHPTADTKANIISFITWLVEDIMSGSLLWLLLASLYVTTLYHTIHRYIPSDTLNHTPYTIHHTSNPSILQAQSGVPTSIPSTPPPSSSCMLDLVPRTYSTSPTKPYTPHPNS